MKKIVWLTDTHLTLSFLWKKYVLVKHLKKIDADALILTGDISNGLFIDYVLYYIASHVNIPIYYVNGNHDRMYKDFDDSSDDLRAISRSFANFHWLDEEGFLKLNSETAIIGVDGWYSWLKCIESRIAFTLDWLLISNFRKLKSMAERVSAFRKLSKDSAEAIEPKLLGAIKAGYKTIYLATHYPPFRETNMHKGKWFEAERNAYDTNDYLGEKLKDIMSQYLDIKLIVLAGHSHIKVNAKISDNIECRVNNANYFNVSFKNEEIIIL